MKAVYITNSHYITYTFFSLIGWENVLFELGSERIKRVIPESTNRNYYTVTSFGPSWSIAIVTIVDGHAGYLDNSCTTWRSGFSCRSRGVGSSRVAFWRLLYILGEGLCTLRKVEDVLKSLPLSFVVIIINAAIVVIMLMMMIIIIIIIVIIIISSSTIVKIIIAVVAGLWFRYSPVAAVGVSVRGGLGVVPIVALASGFTVEPSPFSPSVCDW